jgi:hypothetical protein
VPLHLLLDAAHLVPAPEVAPACAVMHMIHIASS